ncbi:MAG TPA: hypothetical protein VLN49_16715 [Gemmatimonadaceae bacterium]|nr:hypothetical protein [Gemmatimonadaceae bacterium]
MADRPLFEDIVRRAFDANTRYWESVSRAATDYVQTVTKIWADAPIAWTPGVRAPSSRATAADATSGPALLLEGAAGSHARAVVMISNDLDREAEASVHVSALRGPDGRFAALEIRTSPDSVKLAAGERAPVTLIADISDALVAGADYHGEINVPGLSSRGIPLIVRRRGA